MSTKVPSIQEAAQAAMQVAAQHGLPAQQVEVLHAAGNIWMHLLGTPVVAQVPKDVIAVRGPSAITHLRRDVDVCRWLDGRGLAVGQPSDVIDPGPHEIDDISVAFFRHYERADSKDDMAAGVELRRLHEALLDYDGDLSELKPLLHEPRRVLGQLAAGHLLGADEIRMLNQKLDAAEMRLGGFPSRPVHGDVHLQNVIWTADGPRWTDWEDVCIAPIEWDLACLLISTELYGIEEERMKRALRGYDAEPDLRELRPFMHLRVVQVSAWAATRAEYDQVARRRLKDGLRWLRYHHL